MTVVEIPEEHLRAFPKEEINALPLRRYDGPVHVVRTRKQRDAAIKVLRNEALLGFDTETRPVFKKGRKPNPPSLIQLAGEQNVYIFQINLLPMDNGLLDLLSSKQVIKTGVSVHDDIIGLNKLAKFKAANFIDLGEISQKHQMQTHGLRNLAANLLGFRISKSAQCSNWAKENLTRQQVTYAATDAWVSRKIYLAMNELGLV
ncbi:3'-5' exonuclease [Pseudodesulfovibrio senegalensis]|uniref:3'-5' exonuclease domain-containing protein 2 n=1 Tax=Pseudodesulfovibrio senegalensis TaxID=1721087 RepID=A0A6N6N1I6_9BACT|nr:3'-5' exonuclease [Pseudodesulfovibrio senegalensis]KAB1441471.1 3'-5' exonuclease domain-containing protein 2 [Pseudodesulfovibrio senegalensis]